MALRPANTERRQFGRRETNLHAWIKVPGRPSLPCIVKDISVEGARLICEMPHALPFSFDLVIEASDFHTGCEVRHVSDDGVGVGFCERHAIASLPGAHGSTTRQNGLSDRR